MYNYLYIFISSIHRLWLILIYTKIKIVRYINLVLPVILMTETKVTAKYQTSIPSEIREVLGIKSGDNVEWHNIKGMIVVDTKKKIKDPVKFLTSQIKVNLDAVELVKKRVKNSNEIS